MEIAKFNEFMKEFEIGNEMPKEIGLLAVIEGILDGKPQKERYMIVPPWLYEVKGSCVVLHLREPLEVQAEGKFLSALAEQKPYIKIMENEGIWNVEAPLSVEKEE